MPPFHSNDTPKAIAHRQAADNEVLWPFEHSRHAVARFPRECTTGVARLSHLGDRIVMRRTLAQVSVVVGAISLLIGETAGSAGKQGYR